MKLPELISFEGAIHRCVIKARKKASKAFRLKHRGWIRFLDILVVLAMLCNYGALMLTNVMVVKTSPEPPVFKEINPAMAEQNDYELHPDSTNLFAGFVMQIIYWVAIILVYLWQRSTIFTDSGMFLLTFLGFWFFIVCSVDVVNNLGLWIGTLL